MTQTKRIIVNTLATYGRTLIGVACGIFSTRWVLMALGHEDFGLYGVVGSMVIFVSFFNIQFSGALSRFYAVSIGQAKISNDSNNALENCRCWFTTGVLIHSILPIILIAIGYPIGVTAIRNGWLTIPINRIETCVWIWRFFMISCFISMVNVPFQAMYTAKQCIVELTVYSILQVFLKTAFIYFMTTIEYEWLFGYGLAICIITIMPQLIICFRAISIFPECRFRLHAFSDYDRIKQIATYAWWQVFGGISFIARHQCLEVIVNKFSGPLLNAAYTVGSTVGGEASALTGALNTAFGPAVATVYGTRNYDLMREMAYRACKFGLLLTLIFALPLFFEVNQVLILWLKTPPRYAEGFCLFWLAAVVIDKGSIGHIQAVNASGRIACFQVARCLALCTAIPISIMAAFLGQDVYMVGWGLLVSTCLSVCTDVIIAQRKIGLSIVYWMRHIILPVAGIVMVGSVCVVLLQVLIPPSFVRLILVTFLVDAVLLALSWRYLLNLGERGFIVSRIRRYFKSRILS